MTDPMHEPAAVGPEGLDLDAIRARAEAAANPGPGFLPREGWMGDLINSQADVPALLAALAAARAEVEQAHLAMTLSEGEVQAIIAEGIRQKGRANEARAALAALREGVEWAMSDERREGLQGKPRAAYVNLRADLRAALSATPSVRAAADEHGETGAGL